MRRMKKILDEIGPLLAGFQIATSIVGFFGIGAVAKWIIENWIPFTRWAWTELFSFIHLPNITAEEKDALTTLAFFAPMAISAIFAYWYNEPSQSLGVETEKFGKETRLRLYATVIGIMFMLVVGGSVIRDTITLFTTRSESVVSEEDVSPILNIEFFANFGLGVAVLIAIFALTAILVWLSRRNSKIAAKTEAFVMWFSKRTKPITKSFISGSAFSVTTMAVQVIASLVSFSSMTLGIATAAGQLGFIRTASPILVLASFLITIFLNPGRLLKTAGVVIALVVASWGWDTAIWIVAAVENAPRR